MTTNQLEQDLERDQRDVLYRSMTFIARRGGPGPVGDSKAELVAHRPAALHWLRAQPNQRELAHAYAEVIKNWSPVFKD